MESPFLDAIEVGDPDAASVDDIFRQMSIPQIHKLSREYKLKIEKTKSDLHSLVGSKYRDLIKIAEDIDSMYLISSDVDLKLTDLSYQKSNFIPFSNSNSHAKFNTIVRANHAREARRSSRILILRDAVNNILEKFDLKLSINENGSPLVHTSNLIYYAKVYYTIESLFADLLERYSNLKQKFLRLKENFINYLENELSSYNLFDNAVYGTTNDKIKHNQKLKLSDLNNNRTMSSLADAQVFDDLYQEESFDPIEEDPADSFENDEYIKSKHESYNKLLPPIVNYLIAYTIANICNAELNSVQKVLLKFIQLRHNYLESLLNKADTTYDATQLNYFVIFKFIENTCGYIEKYFENVHSTYHRSLNLAIRPWKASNLLGFRGWFNEEDVNLKEAYNYEVFPLQVSASIENLPNVIYNFMKNKIISTKVEVSFENVWRTLLIYHNFFFGLIRLFDYASFNESQSKLITIIENKKEDNILIQLTKAVKKVIQGAFSDHYGELLSKDNSSIITKIQEYIHQRDKSEHSEERLELFSSGLTDLMDANLEMYIGEISNISFASSGETISDSLMKWFDKFDDFNILLDLHSAQDDNKLSSFNCLKNLNVFLSRPISETKQEIKWGLFDKQWFESEFSSLYKELNSSFSFSINSFVSDLQNILESSESNDIVSYYYLLNILITIKERLTSLDTVNLDVILAESSIDELCKKLFSYSIEELPKDKFFASFDDLVHELVLSSQMEDLPTRPSLKLAASIYELATSYLSAGVSDTNHTYEKLFLSVNGSIIFVNLKNKWIQHELINERFDKAIEKLLTKDQEEEKVDIELRPKQENQVSNAPSKEVQAVNIFANMVFLYQFITSSEEDSQMFAESTFKKLNENGTLIDDVTLRIVTKSIVDYFKSSQTLYLPLLI